MGRPLIGDLLRRIVPLTPHDVEEILNEQGFTQKRFGETALSLGKCMPHHVWNAWSQQVAGRNERVKIAQIGVDVQATSLLAGAMAWRYRVCPLRAGEDSVLLATADPTHANAYIELPQVMTLQPRFVIAEESEIDWALQRYYPMRAAV